jgi:hypothetical protein
MDQFESKLIEIATGKTPQEVQEAQDARLAQAEYANRLALNDEKTRIAQEVYGIGAHTTYDGYVLDPRGSFYLSELAPSFRYRPTHPRVGVSERIDTK